MKKIPFLPLVISFVIVFIAAILVPYFTGQPLLEFFFQDQIDNLTTTIFIIGAGLFIFTLYLIFCAIRNEIKDHKKK